MTGAMTGMDWLPKLLILVLSCTTEALYEDQIGKFDWLQQYVGLAQHAVFDQSSQPARRILVSTSHNVLAALSTKNGDIVWRHVLETGESGNVDLLMSESSQVTTIAGNLLRTWDVITAALLEEIAFQYTPVTSLLSREVSLTSSEVILVELQLGSVTITILDRSSGAPLHHHVLPAPWLGQDTKCLTAGLNLVCAETSLGLIFTLSMAAPEPAFDSQPITTFGMESSDEVLQLEKVSGSSEHLIIKSGSVRKLLHMHGKEIHQMKDISGSVAAGIVDDFLYTASQDGRQVTVSAFDLSTGDEVDDQSVIVELPAETGDVLSLVMYRFERRDGGFGMRAIITCSDHSLHLIGSSGIIWSREEAMASIASIESVDLPTTPYYQDQIYEPSGMFGSFFHRVRTQWIHTIGWFGRAFGSQDSFDPHQPSIVRDAFNLRKMLIIVTNSGKILGVDSWNGDIIWSLFVREMAPLNGGKLLIYQQRTVAHFPQPPQCVVIGKHKHSGDGLLVVVNPITGELLGGSYGAGIINLGFKLHQALIIQYMDQFYLKPVVLIDSNQNVKVFPSSGEAVVLEHGKQLYVHLAHHDSSILKGYSFAYSKPGALLLTEVWRITLGGGPITGVYGKESNELVHSPGRVLADRSVLYKYVNPNLVVVTTQGYDHINKNTLTVHLVDTVTGTVIESVSHKRVSGPVHIVHSENWVVYTCFNEKYRRSEVTSLELFEGLTQANSTAFSSFSVRATPPILEKQAFIIPQGVQAASHTTTEKGITTKFLLFALQSGNILQLSKYFLDPRRPVSASAPREEGLIPYMPELPLPPQEMINYNNTLPRVNAIFTATTGLESTCLVLVYGLDVFYTRVFPSKMFDMLKDDFDHYLIVGALLALLTGALVARRMAQRKALNQAWK